MPTAHIIPSTLGFQRCLRPLGWLECSKPRKLHGASLSAMPVPSSFHSFRQCSSLLAFLQSCPTLARTDHPLSSSDRSKRDAVCGTRIPRANGRRALRQSHHHNVALPSAPQGLEPAFQDTARRPARAFGFSKTHSSKQHRIEMTPLLLTLSVLERNPGKEQ